MTEKEAPTEPYTVTIKNGRGIQVGDANTVTNIFFAAASAAASGVAGNLAYDLLKGAVRRRLFPAIRRSGTQKNLAEINYVAPTGADQELIDYSAKMAVALRLQDFGIKTLDLSSLHISSTYATRGYACIAQILSYETDDFEAHVYFPDKEIEAKGVRVHFPDDWLRANASVLMPATSMDPPTTDD
ncbi:hypothetical protein ACIA5C_48315 [Actinoplanes sp. NPDC051343]|uniref:hypothetical protein n=1 Tax=Actinoplanes sp. NPDC051343 TaxID=3363906 RepID=UPI0037B2CD42